MAQLLLHFLLLTTPSLNYGGFSPLAGGEGGHWHYAVEIYFSLSPFKLVKELFKVLVIKGLKSVESNKLERMETSVS